MQRGRERESESVLSQVTRSVVYPSAPTPSSTHCSRQLSAMRQAMWHCTLASHRMPHVAAAASSLSRLFELGKKVSSSSSSDSFE